MQFLFSFALYGSDPKYYVGAARNVAAIRQHFPEATIRFYVGPGVEAIPGCQIVTTDVSGATNMLKRFKPLFERNTDYDYCFIRDADSRVTERDAWCIRAFITSGKPFHIIRDHYYHKSHIMGGLFGFKMDHSIVLREADLPSTAGYGDDEAYLAATLYPLIRSEALVHTNCLACLGEYAQTIDCERKDSADFIGNVYDSEDRPLFLYAGYPMYEYLEPVAAAGHYSVCRRLIEETSCLAAVPYPYRTAAYDAAMRTYYYLGDLESARQTYASYDVADIDDRVVSNSNWLLAAMVESGWSLVATTDSRREPVEPKELVICYGNFPIGPDYFPVSKKMYRHVCHYAAVKHTRVECDPCWSGIDQIFIIALETRWDSYIATFLELCRAGAPLDKVQWHRATPNSGIDSKYIGATKSHVEVLRCCGPGHTLVLEDDFTFSDWLPASKAALTDFVKRSYVYDVCFLAASRFHQREIYDDLLVRSYQACTTSAGYLVHGSTVAGVLAVVEEGLQKMIDGGYRQEYVIDRYWSKLGRMFIFKRKIGFQKPQISGIRGHAVNYLD